MPDEQQQDLLRDLPPEAASEPASRRRGLLGRFRRRRDEASEAPEPSSVLEVEAPLEPARRLDDPVAGSSEDVADLPERLDAPPSTRPPGSLAATDAAETSPDLAPGAASESDDDAPSSPALEEDAPDEPFESDLVAEVVDDDQAEIDQAEIDQAEIDQAEIDQDDAEADVTAEALPVAAVSLEDERESLAEPRVVRRRAGISAHLVVLSVLASVVTMSFLLIEPTPRWLLLLGAAAVVFGLDGTLRHTWREPFASGAETAPYLFVPALYMLAVPVVIEHNIAGELVLLVGLLACAGFALLAWAETASVRPLAPEYDLGRVVVTAGTYVAGFAIFSLTYVFEVELQVAVLAVGLAATMLAVEVLREGEIDPGETLGFALVTGVIMAEARLLLYYVPLDTYLAGLTLLLGFYLVTGLLHSHITRAFSWTLSAEYGGIAAAGLTLVVLARAVGLA